MIMGGQVFDRGEQEFVPWCDQALLPGESSFAVMNKVAWFVAMPCTQLVRQLREQNDRKVVAHPKAIKYSHDNKWISFVERTHLAPVVHGMALQEYLYAVEELNEKETPLRWRSAMLRFCPECIAIGIHFRLHQHLAVEKCPFHLVALRSTCVHCGVGLRYESASEGPFCCPHCGRSMLQDGMIATQLDPGLQEEMSRRVDESAVWLGPASTARELMAGVRDMDVDVDHPLQGVTGKRIYLEALCERRGERPAWLVGRKSGECTLSFSTLSLASPGLRPECASLDLLLQLDSPLCDSSLSSIVSGNRRASEALALDDHYRRACRRVSEIFLRRFGCFHQECLDAPYRMYGDRFDGTESHIEELFGCCSVAIGFWLWRRACHRTYKALALYESLEKWHFLVDVPDHLRDALLYSVVRSLLHYCVFVANECVRDWEKEDADPFDCAQPIIAIGHIDYPWSSIFFERQRMLVVGGHAYCLKFDATEVLLSKGCPGRLAYQKRLRRMLRSVEVIGRGLQRPIYLDMEDEWASRQLEQERPFARMKGDWIFFPQEPSSEDSRTDLWFLGLSLELERPLRDTVHLDRSINSRAGLP